MFNSLYEKACVEDLPYTNLSFIDQLKLLNDRLEMNFMRMKNLNPKSQTYKELYEENEILIREAMRLCTTP